MVTGNQFKEGLDGCRRVANQDRKYRHIPIKFESVLPAREVKRHLGKSLLHLPLNRWQITIFVCRFVSFEKENLMLLRKCLILLALVSFSAVPMMGCTPSAENTDVEIETGTTDDSDPGADDETENSTNTD